jgi:RNA polymerase sigma-70 factor (ECF subfamily)
MSDMNTARPERSGTDDTALALAAGRGDVAAFEEIVRRYQGRVYATAYRVTGNREDALDVTQDALVKAYQKIGTWAPTGSFISWLLRLTTNQAIDHLRRRNRRRQEPLDEAFVRQTEGAAVEPTVDSTESVVRGREMEARVRGALVKLSRMQRTVFVLRHFEEFSLAEIAEELGCTVGSVKVHLFRALKKLRDELGDLMPDDSRNHRGETQ